MQVEPLAVPAGPGVVRLLPRLAEAIRGGNPVLPVAAAAPPARLPDHDPADLPEDLAVVVGTSGSTGTPKRALLTAAALRASTRATHDRLGGPGQWLLSLPAHHVAGLQVLLRSLDAGTEPVVIDLTHGFLPRVFAEATARLDPGARRYTSLVPTQLVRLLDDPVAGEALRCYDAVVVGGAATPPRLLRRARRRGGAGRDELRHERVLGRMRARWPTARVHRGRLRRGGADPPRRGDDRARLPRASRPHGGGVRNRRGRHPVVPHRRRGAHRRARPPPGRRPGRRHDQHRRPQGGSTARRGGDHRSTSRASARWSSSGRRTPSGARP